MPNRLLGVILRHLGGPADPDADLLARFSADRDEAAFAELVRRHGPMVWAVCRNLLADEADAEDAFQAVWLVLVRSAGRVRTPAAVGGWLHGTAVKVCTQAKRSAARRRQREQSAANERRGSPPPAGPDWHDLHAAVHAAVGRLPDRERTVFVLCALEGVRQADAAARLGLKLNTVSGLLARGRKRVLAELTAKGLAPAAAVATAGSLAAVPGRAAEAVVAFAAGSAVASESVLHLAKGVAVMGLTKAKLVAAGVVLAAAVGVTVWSSGGVPTADAQSGPEKPPPADTRPSAYENAYRNAVREVIAQKTPAARPQWEYKFVNFGDKDYEKQANELGTQGWEMVGTVTGNTFFFKRPVVPAADARTTERPSAPPRGASRSPAMDSLVEKGYATGTMGMGGAPPAAVTQMITLEVANTTEYAELLTKMFPQVTTSGVNSSKTLVLRGPESQVKQAMEMAEAMAVREAKRERVKQAEGLKRP